MKNKISSLLVIVALFVACLFASLNVTAQSGITAGLLTFFILDAALASVVSFVFGIRIAGLFTATLIVPILTGKVMEAFKTKVPSLDFFSTDWGRDGGNFAQPAKFGQQVISQLALVPTVSRATPGGLLAASQSATSLVTDLIVAIDRMATVKVRLPSQDIQQLLVMPAFLQSLAEAGMALGRFVVGDALNEAASARNFTHSITAANPDLDTLEAGRQQLTVQQALEPRYGLGTTAFMGAIGGDPRVLYSWGYGQKTSADPYAQWDNIKGFTTLKEAPNFPNGDKGLATVTANAGTDRLTITGLTAGIDPAFDIYNGARVQISSTGNIPAGLAAATNYYVVNAVYTGDAHSQVGGDGVGITFQLSATLGGANIDITDAGTGVISITQNENMEAFFFEKRAIHIASRPMIDQSEAAKALGIPTPILVQRETDPITGLSFLVFLWQDISGANPTLDIFATFVVQYGIRAGRGINGANDPATYAADTGMDRAGLRVITG
jgi:hypothetical protein